MVESSPAERVPERTAEQHQAVRRRALPVGVAGVALGAAAVGLALTTHVSAYALPSLLGANLAFCAMLIGAGILFYVRGTPRTRSASVASLLALALGMAGTLLYTWQSVQSRQARENLESANVRAIARAAGAWATQHGGEYPADLLVLLEDQEIPPQALQSPYGRRDPFLNSFMPAFKLPGWPASLPATQRADLLRSVESASDYLYLGGDLKHVPPDAAPALIVAVSANTVLRVSLAVAFADGTSRFITVDQVPTVIAACNAARKKLGLADLHPPAILQSALDEVKAPNKP
jgi:hypothetical protein